MYDPLGLSIGTMNMVAAVDGSPPVIRRSVLTLYPHCAPKLGLSDEVSHPDEPGIAMTDFVDRIGESVTLMSEEGSAHDPDLLAVEALDAMVTAAGADSSCCEIAIAVPAHWNPNTVQALRNALRTHIGFVRSGTAPLLVPDAVAALTAVKAQAELPSAGVVALLDFGSSATNVTLLSADGARDPVSATMRYEDFSGDRLDHALLLHVSDVLRREDAGLAGVTDLGRVEGLRALCRTAKERLSVDRVTELTGELAGSAARVRLTREEFDELIRGELIGFIAAFDDMLARNNFRASGLAGLVAVGGGAGIPLVAQHLTEHTELPVFTAARPDCAAAEGALLLAKRGDVAELRTSTSINMAAMTVPVASPIDLPPVDAMAIGPHLQEEPADRELAWSRTESPELLTRCEEDSYHDEAPCFSMAINMIDPPKETPWTRLRVSQVLIGLCAAVAMTALGGVAITLTAIEQRQAPRHTPAVPSVAPPPASARPPLATPAPEGPAGPDPAPPATEPVKV
ncbi:Hsp70 family protein, partial [Mycobacterium sp.]|uniref:Hsp70 family protein n=1 Tax=Mycobacterium sp. TaxID=1785 RepID=UPI003A85F23A